MYQIDRTDNLDGFEINYYWDHESVSVRDVFEETEERYREMERRLNAYVDHHVVFKVTASREGIELGCDYLGSLYDSVHPERMFEDGLYGYLEDMVDRAISEARETIERIVKKINPTNTLT